MSNNIFYDRASSIGRALSKIPMSLWEEMDRKEPEWPLINRIAKMNSPWNLAVGITLALCDFQLGAGGAERYWTEVENILDLQKPIEDVAGIHVMIQELLKRPVAARLAKLKMGRVERLLRSSFVAYLQRVSLTELETDPMRLWYCLASEMGQSVDAKTIVFAMKITDLLHKAATGRYLRFPAEIPIVLDIRIGRVSLSSGLTPRPPGWDINRAMMEVSEILQQEKSQILSSWRRVAKTSGGTSIFRIDSLIWQVAEPIYKWRNDKSQAKRQVVVILEARGCCKATADSLGDELTFAL